MITRDDIPLPLILLLLSVALMPVEIEVAVCDAWEQPKEKPHGN